MCVKVRCITKNTGGTITHVGGSADDGSMRWGLTRTEAIQRIESNEWSFFVARPAADPVPVTVRTVSGVKTLTTAPDDTQTNNLALLSVCDMPLSGTDPQFPLSIPGPRQPALVQVEGRGAGGGVVVLSPDANGHFKIPGWTPAKPLTRLRLICNIPFPADLEVYVERDPLRPDYVEADHKLTKIDSSSPAQVQALESQGKGWYDWILRIPDASYPHRFTPVIVPVGIPGGFKTGSGLTLFMRSVSSNRYCPGPSVPLPIVVYRTPFIPPYTYTVSNSPGGGTKPPREYKVGAFSAWQPAIRNIGQSTTKGTDKRLEVKSPVQVVTTDWPQFGIYINSTTSKNLCQPVGFAVLTGTGTAGGGIGFSATGEFGVALAILQPNVPARTSNVLFRFVKLGAPAAQPMDVEGFLTTPTTPNATVTPQIFFDQAEQVALVVDANRFGGHAMYPGRARLLDLGHGASPLRSIEFNGTMLSATVAKRSDGAFEAVITTNAGVTTVALPRT